jgi:hypothetical protein
MAAQIMNALAVVLVIAALGASPAAAARRRILEEEAPCRADPIVGKPNPEKVFHFGLNFFVGLTGYFEVGNQRPRAPTARIALG